MVKLCLISINFQWVHCGFNILMHSPFNFNVCCFFPSPILLIVYLANIFKDWIFPEAFRVFCFVLFHCFFNWIKRNLFLYLLLLKNIFLNLLSVFHTADADEYYMQLIKITIQREIFGKDWKQLFHFVYSSFYLVSVYVILEDNI